jgi:hypothetical protein
MSSLFSISREWQAARIYSRQKGRYLKGTPTNRFNLNPDWRIQHMSVFTVSKSHIAPATSSNRQRTEPQFQLDPLMLTIAHLQQLQFALDCTGALDEVREIQQEMARLNEERKREEEHWGDMGHYLD